MLLMQVLSVEPVNEVLLKSETLQIVSVSLRGWVYVK